MEKYRFPQCFGVVDGSHIPIVSPQYYPADYYNRKGWHSVILQGTVNHLGQFIDVNVGWPGRVHDARVFSNSKIFELGQAGKLVPDCAKTLTTNSQKVPLCILGDPAYPLLPWVMKAFADNGRLTRQQKTFNYRLCRTRVVVEHTYGRLKGRWRCLLKQLDIDVSNVPDLVAACCTLHNICEAREFFVITAQTSCTMMHTADLDTPKRCPMVLKSEPVDRYHRVIATLFFVMNRCSHNGVFLLN